MPDFEKLCPKCHAAMFEGFIPDRMDGGTAVREFYDRPPEKSIWVGVKLSGRKHYEVKTFRCPQCGYLESYAP
jgi:hypothetical protein